jgi:hypothetical protein
MITAKTRRKSPKFDSAHSNHSMPSPNVVRGHCILGGTSQTMKRAGSFEPALFSGSSSDYPYGVV